jgi:hypothetical protein
MWAAKDNETNVNWHEAKAYCDNYRGGGYTDWRMPNGRELASLYDPTRKDRPGARVSDLIKISTSHGWTWEVSAEGDRAAAFNFSEGRFGGGIPKSYDEYRALPVRTVSNSKPAEIGRDGRFIAYSDGTVLDTGTNLMWAAKDDGNGVNWTDARRYCENFRGGGYEDWRMPTKNELVGLYKSVNQYAKSGCGRDAHLTKWIRFTCGTWVWASETRGSEAAYLSFGALGAPDWNPQSDRSLQALPVRFAK